jgi:probable F420-dependent oxidoreductase
MELGLTLRADHPGYSLEDSAVLAQEAEVAGFDSLWRGETSGLNSFMLLQHVARHTSDIRLGTGIVNVYSRSPTLLAMSTATLNLVAGDRTILGLGVSSKRMVERWHGHSFTDPIRRSREVVEIIDQVFQTGTADYKGDHFDIGPYEAAFETRSPPPVYLAAMGETNLRLTGAVADGWIPSLLSMNRLEEAMATIRMEASRVGRPPDAVTTAPFVLAATDPDPKRAEYQVRRYLAREIAIAYEGLVESAGFGEAAALATERWRAGDRDAAAAVLPREMVEEFAIYGTRAAVRRRLSNYRALGLDAVVLIPSFAADREDVGRTIQAVTI